MSDLDDPQLADRLTLTDVGWSEAQTEHLAFNFFAPTRSLSIPGYSYESGQAEMHVIRAGVGESLDLLGSFDQSSILDESQMEDWNYAHCTAFNRSVVMQANEGTDEQDTVFALSSAGIVASPVNAPGELTASLAYEGIEVCSDENYYYW